MPHYGERLLRMLDDDTLIDSRGIANLLSVSLATVRKWHANPDINDAQQRHVRLPASNPEHAVKGRTGRARPQWPLKVIVAWAIDPLAPNGGTRLDYDGNPIVRRRRPSTPAA